MLISGTRKIGITAFIAGAALTALLGSLAATYDLLRFKLVVLLLAVPVAITLAGLFQAIAGVPFFYLATKWDQLQGWQRGVLGILVVVIFGSLVFAAIILFGI